MKICFVHSEGENLGVEYLAACLKAKGHEVFLAFDPLLFNSYRCMNSLLGKNFSYSQLVKAKVMNLDVDLICFSVIADTYGWALAIAEDIKRNSNVPIVFGGIHATSVPDIIIKEECVDYVCMGEAEEAICDLAFALESKQDVSAIKNIWTKIDNQIIDNDLRPLLCELDRLPYPDKDLFANEYAGLVTNPYKIITARGCPYKCSFCYNSLVTKLYGTSFLRRRSVDNVIGELIWAKEKYGFNRLFILDDVFTYDKSWLRDFSVLYKGKIDLPFYCDLHSLYTDAEIISLLEYAGCTTANLGIQTTDDELRKDVLNRFDSNENIIESIRLVKNSKILLYVNIMLGLPGQDDRELINIAKFLNKTRPDFVFPFWLRYYPRTTVVDIAKNRGILNDWQVKEIEESKEYAPFVMHKPTSDKGYAKLRNLILLSPVLPRVVFRCLVRFELYRFFPISTFLFFDLNIKIVHLLKRLFEGKKGFITFNEQFQIYRYYILKKILVIMGLN